MADKNWISGAIKHPGALHAHLGIPKGEKIPEGRLRNAARQGGVIGKEANLALTLKGFNKKGK